MATAYVSSVSAASAAGTSITSAAFTTSGDDRVLLAIVRYTNWSGDNTTSRTTSVVRDGQNFTLISPDTGAFPSGESSSHFEVWALAAPSTSSAAVVVTFENYDEYIDLVVLQFTGAVQSAWDVEQSLLDRDADSDPTTLDTTLTLATGDMGVAIAWFREDWNIMGDPAFTAGTERVAQEAAETGGFIRVSTYTGSGSTTATADMDKNGTGVSIYHGGIKVVFVNLASATPPTTDADGTISATGTLTGATSSTVTTRGSISGASTLTGATSSSATSAGSIAATGTLNGVGASSATAAGSITAQAVMSGVGRVLGTYAVEGSISSASTLTGDTRSTATAAGRIQAVATLDGVGNGIGVEYTQAAGSISASATLTGAGASSAAADGLIEAEATLSGYTVDDDTETQEGPKPRVLRPWSDEDEEAEVFALLAGAAIQAAVCRRRALSGL